MLAPAAGHPVHRSRTENERLDVSLSRAVRISARGGWSISDRWRRPQPIRSADRVATTSDSISRRTEPCPNLSAQCRPFAVKARPADRIARSERIELCRATSQWSEPPVAECRAGQSAGPFAAGAAPLPLVDPSPFHNSPLPDEAAHSPGAGSDDELHAPLKCAGGSFWVGSPRNLVPSLTAQRRGKMPRTGNSPPVRLSDRDSECLCAFHP